jgi:hypothetical protein
VGEWFHNEVLTTGFALLDRILGCKKHKISICDPWAANALYSYFHQSRARLRGHEIAVKCRDMDFIILPVSDGFKKMRLKREADANHQATIELLRETGSSEAEIDAIVRQYQKVHAYDQDHGSHWSVLIVDCRGKGLRARYLDSWKDKGYEENREVAHEVAAALLKFFEFDMPGRYAQSESKFPIDANMPKQHMHNLCENEEGSACGSFVWAIVKEYTQYIVECREDEERTWVPVPIELKLPGDFNIVCGWDSGQSRRDVRNLINREGRVRMYLSEPFGGTHLWFDDRTTGKIG